MSVCKYCQGTGKIGFQQEGCCYCSGSGYIKEKLIVDKATIENGLNELINRHINMMKNLGICAYTEEDCINKLELIRKEKYIEDILRQLFDLQPFEYVGNDFGGIEIK